MNTNRNTHNTKYAAGIACCRYYHGKPQILLIKKRHTYQFVEFIFGCYHASDIKRLRYLFSHMTTAEKMDVLTLNFDLLWCKMWINNVEIAQFHREITDNQRKFNIHNELYIQAYEDNWHDALINKMNNYRCDNRCNNNGNMGFSLRFYNRKKNKFESLIKHDSGKLLRNIINNSQSRELMWEIPKGRLKYGENFAETAIREFTEETMMLRSHYQIMFNIPTFNESYRDFGITYVNKYFIAKAHNNFIPKVKYNTAQSSEVDTVSWMFLDDIKFIDSPSGNLYSFVKKIFKTFHNKCREI